MVWVSALPSASASARDAQTCGMEGATRGPSRAILSRQPAVPSRGEAGPVPDIDSAVDIKITSGQGWSR